MDLWYKFQEGLVALSQAALARSHSAEPNMQPSSAGAEAGGSSGPVTADPLSPSGRFVVPSLPRAPPTPDRPHYQQQLSRLNSEIAAKSEEKASIIGNAIQGVTGQLKGLSEQLTEGKKNRDLLKQQATELDPAVEKFDNEIKEKDRKLRDMEADMPYKDPTKLDGRLAVLRNTYQKTQMDIHSEQNYVKEIDKLERNKKKLSSFLVIQEERKAIDKKRKEVLQERRQKRLALRRQGQQMRLTREKRDRLCRRVGELKTETAELISRRRQLIENYNRSRQDYQQFQRRQQQGVVRSTGRHLRQTAAAIGSRFAAAKSYSQVVGGVAQQTTASFKKKQKADVTVSLNNNNLPDSDSDDEAGLEPFHEEKRDCNILLNYLNSLLQHMDETALAELAIGGGADVVIGVPPVSPGESIGSGTTNASSSLTKSNSQESVDGPNSALSSRSASFLVDVHNATSSQAVYRRPSLDVTQPAVSATHLTVSGGSPKHLRKRSKKSTKKASQAITADTQVIKMFSALEIDQPYFYSDIPDRIQKVTAKLKFLVDQTDLQLPFSFGYPDDDEDELKFMYPSSESEFTSDSGAWGSRSFSTDISESQSLASLNLTPGEHHGSASSLLPFAGCSSSVVGTPLSPELEHRLDNRAVDDAELTRMVAEMRCSSPKQTQDEDGNARVVIGIGERPLTVDFQRSLSDDPTKTKGKGGKATIDTDGVAVSEAVLQQLSNSSDEVNNEEIIDVFASPRLIKAVTSTDEGIDTTGCLSKNSSQNSASATGVPISTVGADDQVRPLSKVIAPSSATSRSVSSGVLSSSSVEMATASTITE